MSDGTIGIVGVGMMGHGIASNLQKNGWQIGFVDHPGNQPTDDLRKGGAWVTDSPASLAARCDTIILCVTGTPQVEAVMAGKDGILAAMSEGKVVIDCSTAVPELDQKDGAAGRKGWRNHARRADDAHAEGSRRGPAQPDRRW